MTTQDTAKARAQIVQIMANHDGYTSTGPSELVDAIMLIVDEVMGGLTTSDKPKQPKDTKSVTWGSFQEQSLWKLLHEEKYDLELRLAWFCDGPEHAFIKGRVLARYLEELTDLVAPDPDTTKDSSNPPKSAPQKGKP